MSAFGLTRLAALGAFGALVLGAAASVQSALARVSPIGAIHVDVAPLLANSGEPTVAWVAHDMAAALVADGRSGTPVSVTIDNVILGPSSGGAGSMGSAPDQMTGTVTIDGVTRPLRATSTYFPSAVNNALLEQSCYYRIYDLSQAFAYWAAREP